MKEFSCPTGRVVGAKVISPECKGHLVTRPPFEEAFTRTCAYGFEVEGLWFLSCIHPNFELLERESSAPRKVEENAMTATEPAPADEDTHAGAPLTMAAEETRERIIEAAIDRFGSHGFDTGLETIAETATSAKYWCFITSVRRRVSAAPVTTTSWN